MQSKPILQFPYEGLAFQRSWHTHLASKFPLGFINEHFALLKRKVFAGIPWLTELRIPGWNSAWAQDFTEEHAHQLCEGLTGKRWSHFTFEWSDSRKLMQAIPLLKEKGYPVFNAQIDAYYIADTSLGWDGYFQQQSKKHQKDILKRLRKAEENNSEVITFEGQNGIVEFFDIFFPAHIQYWGSREGGSFFSDKREQDFFIDWCKALNEEERLKLTGLKLNNELCYLSMGIQYEAETFLGVLAITVGEQKRLAPGIIATYLQIKAACEKGIKVFNMGPGYYPYKAQASTYTDPCYKTIVINPLSCRGRLYQGYLMYKKWQNNRKKHSKKIAVQL